MLVSFKQIVDGVSDGNLSAEWLFAEILQSLPQSTIEQAQVRQEFNVQLVIDNVVVEPQLLGDIFLKMETYIKNQGEHLVRERLVELERRFSDIFGPLEEATRVATEKIKQEFNIKEDE